MSSNDEVTSYKKTPEEVGLLPRIISDGADFLYLMSERQSTELII